MRVTRLGIHIAQAESADVEVVRAAALLHDVPVEDGGRDAHHMAAAVFAAGYLRAAGMEPARIENVVHCIQAHRYRDRSIQPRTLEAKCLYDADKLDSIGAIGVGRAFAHAGRHGNRLWNEEAAATPPECAIPDGRDYTPVHEYVYKLSRVLPTLHTSAARRLGEERQRFMRLFFEQLDAEMTGRK
ncbi:MAG: HD domain-containing protein [Caldilineaceae bacterium]|nr:HD domain-containing protein [Caldilineaceae bacterium]